MNFKWSIPKELNYNPSDSAFNNPKTKYGHFCLLVYILSGPDPEGAFAGGGGADPQWRPNAPCGIQEQCHRGGPGKLLNFKH